MVKIAVRMIAKIVPFAYRDCIPEGSATPTTSLAKVWAQLSHSWKVAVQVKPMMIRAKLSMDHLALLMSSMRELFLPDFAAVLALSALMLGSRKDTTPTATTAMASPYRTVCVWLDSSPTVPTMKPTSMGRTFWPPAMKSLVPMVARPVRGAMISTSSGMTPQSRKELATPPRIAAA